MSIKLGTFKDASQLFDETFLILHESFIVSKAKRNHCYVHFPLP